jgi:hypothetical protein
MAVTRIADVIIPEVFTPYVLQMAEKSNNMINSGGIVVDPFLSAFALGGGNTITIPSWEAIDQFTGTFDPQLDDPAVMAPVNAVKAEAEVAVKLSDVKTWGAANLASALAGSNPLSQVADKIAKAINTNRQFKIVSALTGLFAGPLAATNLVDASAAPFEAGLLIDALAPWGDMANEAVVLVVHSAVYRSMQKENLITFRPLSEQNILFPVYMGQYLIVVDDTVPVTGVAPALVYTSYLLKPGAIRIGVGAGETILHEEPLQAGGAGVEYFIQRDTYVPHVVGTAWIGTATGAGPQPAALSNGANWAAVYTPKHIPVAALLSLAGA